MSEIQEIDVFVKSDGSVKIEVRGVKGQKCLDLTKGIEQLLGGKIMERIHTDEFHAAEQEQTQDDRINIG
ncbi:MAG: DUF2997 domain-containing protein [bacterium]|nr:DUF2997 domain-containing protein [bacterium]